MRTPEALRGYVEELLGRSVTPRVDASPDGVWACVGPEDAEVTAGTVAVHRAAASVEDGWVLPELVPGTVAWAPTGAVLAGYGERDGVLVPGVARLEERSVRWFDVPAGPLPMAWLDCHRLVVPVSVTEPSAPPVPAVFEADRFSRVRVLCADVPPPRRYTLSTLDIRDGTVGALSLPTASYHALHACPCGGHLVAGTADAVVLADLPAGVARPLEPNPVGVGWFRDGTTEFLVSLLSTRHGTEIRARTPDGADRIVGVVPGAPLYHSFAPPAPRLLLGDPGTGTASHLVLISPGADGPAVRSWRIDGRPLTHARVAAVDESAGVLRAAVVETRRTRSLVRLLTEDTPGGGVVWTGRRHADATGLGLLGVEDWAGGAVRLAGPGPDPPRRVRLRDTRIVGEPDELAARVLLHPPADGQAPVATAVSLLPRLAGPRSRAPGLLTEHVHWLTRLGFAVAAVDVPLRWWPEVPDERIRAEAVSTITAAVTSSGLTGRLVVHGHSFAATLALQALADTDLFAAAMVSGGGYCRSLTPLGFQYEKRALWAAERVYRDFDAVLSAPRIRRPVLIVHGQRDRNPATPPEAAVLLFQCLTALGTPSRLVLLPDDGHRVRTRGGRATLLSEQAAWMYRWATTTAEEST
ncbi:alpha/beta hydrolase family protein [Actinophytocola oryzae]|uniref:Dipeptidyl aminopeptidase/acylaminoacyl peptidase n=1 Tax=Actinophytocola oryzae TaxID=502181 RepID=A0A4R7VKF0_9PSEU|nr:prolyl oligopeptidase family serine peptidase [Actinophytocola oryzae]TDV49950.1 dipeptidyl aminopeptidase/acylaminoacyl peptidase [Actinophytocola oryzae]